jgi:cation transport ATPase
VRSAVRKNALLRNMEAVERLAVIENVLFDKTGTITIGKPQLQQFSLRSEVVNSMFGGNEKKLLSLIQAASRNSSHPLARTLADTLPVNGFKVQDITILKEFPSQGIEAAIAGYKIRIGKSEFVSAGKYPSPPSNATSVSCSLQDETGQRVIAGEFYFSDELLPSSVSTAESLRKDGYHLAVLSGDTESVVRKAADALGADAYSGLTAEEKLTLVRSTPKSVYIGDGMNDAAAIAAAYVGIAMADGSDIARTQADIVLFDRNVETIPYLLCLSKKTMKIVRQNLAWAFGYNAVGVGLAAAGMLNPIIAALAMALSSFFVVQNSLRLKESGE